VIFVIKFTIFGFVELLLLLLMVYDDDVIRSKDMVVEIIRSNKGLGYEIVRGLAKQGLTIVLTAQDRIKGFTNSRLSKLKALIQFISTN